MKKYVFIVRDKKLGAYGDPVCKVEDVEHVRELAVRGLKDVPAEQLGKVRDSALYYIGTYDDVTGKFEFLDVPEKLVDYEDYITKSEGDADGESKGK